MCAFLTEGENVGDIQGDIYYTPTEPWVTKLHQLLFPACATGVLNL